MVIRGLQSSFKFLVLFFVLGVVISCSTNPGQHENQISGVKDSVQLLINNTEKGLATKGPITWLDYFDNSPSFYMASDGAMAFPDYKAADTFIKGTLVKQLKAINLKLTDVRIDVVSDNYAIIGASFHEDLTDFTGKSMHFDGYFTATAHQTGKGWKYANIHWSIKKP